MENSNLVRIAQFCIHHEIESSFIFALQDFGLVTVLQQEDEEYLAVDEIKDVERMLRLHYDLGINMEGIDAIVSLLKKVNTLQRELRIANGRVEAFLPGDQS